jgi:DNA (cytosine-5)-methyltransferase 1
MLYTFARPRKYIFSPPITIRTVHTDRDCSEPWSQWLVCVREVSMKYLSVCSGIEAATVAWHPLGWKAAAYSEIEAFPSAVLAHHYPDVPNLGDMTKYKEWDSERIGAIDVLAGGTPCQSFSIAGLRQGLNDPRGNLMLTFLAIAERFKPQWLVWENVPGVLSSSRGRDFGTFVGALAKLGYGWAYRVLDAQWFGVAQRRRRVFVVGYRGDTSRAAKVLFESESVCRDPAPSREKGKGITGNVADCLRSGGAGGVPSSRGEHLVGALCSDSHPGSYSGQDAYTGRLIATAFTQNTRDEVRYINGDGQITGALAASSGMKQTNYISFEPGIAAREGGENRFTAEVTGTLRKDMGDNQTAVAIAFHPTQDPISSENTSHALGSKSGNAMAAVATSTAVRRLTPTECERLQGFPDGYTNIPWRKKTESPDGPRYKALGNSMAVPVMQWIGKRIMVIG